MRVIKDDELKAYQEAIGADEYRKEYMYFYIAARQKMRADIRHSKKRYVNSEQKLNEIKAKYANGVTDEILAEWLGGER